MLEEGHTRGEEANGQEEREEDQRQAQGGEEGGPSEKTEVVQWLPQQTTISMFL